MPVTPDQGRMLTQLALDCRPHGAPRWDAVGVMAAIKRVSHLALPDVIHAVVRAAEDREARTPGVISALGSIHWQDRNPDRPTPVQKVNAAELCDVCGKAAQGHSAPDHDYIAQGEYLARRQLPDPEKHNAAVLKQLAACEETTTEETT